MRKGVGRYGLGMVCLALLLATAACGHPAREHIRDWNELFGARDETSQKNLAQLWEKAQKVIDRWQNVYNIGSSLFCVGKDEFKIIRSGIVVTL